MKYALIVILGYKGGELTDFSISSSLEELLKRFYNNNELYYGFDIDLLEIEYDGYAGDGLAFTIFAVEDTKSKIVPFSTIKPILQNIYEKDSESREN